MRVYFTFVVLICFAGFTNGQDNTLREILSLPPKNCETLEPKILQRLIDLSPQQRSDSLDYILDEWQYYCSPSEAQIRVQLLQDITSGDSLPALAELREYLRQYRLSLFEFNHYAFDGSQYWLLQKKLMNYTQKWADSLIQDTALNLQQVFLLDQLRSQTLSEASDKLFNLRYYDLPHVKELRFRAEKNHHPFRWEIAPQAYFYQSELQNYLLISPGLYLGLGDYIDRENYLGLAFQGAIPQYRQSLRINEFDSTSQTKGAYQLSVGVIYSHRFLDNGKQDLRGLIYGGYEFFDVGLNKTETDNSGEETSLDIGLHSYNLGVGAEMNFRINHYNYLGIRLMYHAVDYNLGSRALDNLQGGYFTIGLIYH